jgi:acetamidase/formamidase
MISPTSHCEAAVDRKQEELMRTISRTKTNLITLLSPDIPPIVEVGEGETFAVEEALEKCALAMLVFLQQRTNLADEQAGFLITSVGGLHLSQAGMYDYPVICRAEMPKDVDTLGRLKILCFTPKQLG